MNSPEQNPGRIPEQQKTWNREILVSPKQPIIIGDVSGILRPGITSVDFDNEVEAMVASSFNNDAQYISANCLDLGFTEVVSGMLLNAMPDTTLLIFPGNGANTVRRENPCMWSEIKNQFPALVIKSNRVVQNNIPIDVDIDLSEQDKAYIADMRPTDVVVIDDVIAKGITVKAIRKAMQPYTGTDTTYKAVAWFLRNDADVTGYNRIAALYRYGAIEGYPALNSISTWLRDDEKSKRVLESYKKRFIQYPYGFDKSLSRLKEMVYETN